MAAHPTSPGVARHAQMIYIYSLDVSYKQARPWSILVCIIYIFCIVVSYVCIVVFFVSVCPFMYTFFPAYHDGKLWVLVHIIADMPRRVAV